MEHVSDVCKRAIECVETESGSFTLALRDYFHRVHKVTKAFAKSGLNKKYVFGDACMHAMRVSIDLFVSILNTGG